MSIGALAEPDRYLQEGEDPVAISARNSENQGRIVAGIDGSPASIQALEWALAYAELTASATEVIVAWDWPPDLSCRALFPSDCEPALEC